MENENNDQQQEERLPRIPKGRYRARAMRTENDGLGNSSNKGTPQVVLVFKLLEEDFHGETLPWIGYLTDATEERTLESLRICGWKNDDLSDLDGVCDNDVELVVDHERYEGKLRAKVQFVNRIGGFKQKAPMSQDAAKAFAAKMRDKAAASRVKASSNGGGSKTDVPVVGPDGKPLPF